jgi:hypothetical protein
LSFSALIAQYLKVDVGLMDAHSEAYYYGKAHSHDPASSASGEYPFVLMACESLSQIKERNDG